MSPQLNFAIILEIPQYLRQLHFPDDEPSGPLISRDEFSFEHSALTTEELKEEILHEIQLYHSSEEKDSGATATERLEQSADRRESK